MRDFLPSDRRRRAGVEDATRRALQGFVLPIWIGAGVADWWCHRRTDIEHTAGATESMIHAAMMLEGGLPTLLGLFCEVNAGVLGITYATLASHELTAVWDVAYADGRRQMTPAEQHVHGFLEGVPLMATMLLTGLHWDQARSVFVLGEPPDWRVRLKHRPLSVRYRTGVLVAVSALALLPYGEELVRCLRVDGSDHE
jgi:hypothetical protein